MTKPSITTSILDLLTEETKNLPQAPVPRRNVEEIPDALVLCIIETVCRNCHTIYSHPNARILGRYDRNHRKIKKWSSLFDTLPREVLTIPEDAVNCQNCFEGSVLRTEDIEGEKA